MKSNKYPYAIVEDLAKRYARILAPYCENIKITGSVRRGAEMVGDVELVAIPKSLPVQTDMFGNAITQRLDNQLDQYLNGEVTSGHILKRLETGDRQVWGQKQKKIFATQLDGKIVPVPIDLFIVLPPAQWGPIYAIRTGAAEWNKNIMGLVTRRRGVVQVDGHLEYQGQVLTTPTERSYFDALGIPYVRPHNRIGLKAKELVRLVKPMTDEDAAVFLG